MNGPLTIPLRRAYIASFWTVMTLVMASAFATLAMLRGRSPAWALAALLLMLPRLADPHWFETFVRGWNGVIRRASAPLRGYVLRATYTLLFWPASGAGSALELDWTSRSKWNQRTRLERPLSPIVLAPALWLLWVLRDETHETAPPSTTSYTLY